jgi:hypothetical protein
MTTTVDTDRSTATRARPLAVLESGLALAADPLAAVKARGRRPQKGEIRPIVRYGIPVELVAGKPVALAKTYSERSDLLTGEDEWLLDLLFANRLVTKGRVAQFFDPVAARYDGLPASVKPELSATELERRLEYAGDQASRLINRSLLLGWVELSRHVRAAEDSDKARALAQTRVEKVVGRRPDLIYLSRDGVRLVKERLGFEPEDPPLYSYFERAHSRLAHTLAAPDLYIDLLAYQELGLFDLISFVVEYSWLDELAIGGDPRSTKQRRPLRTDVMVTVSPAGRADLAEVICVEIDRGTQAYTRKKKQTSTQTQQVYPGQPLATSLAWKLEQYWVLAKRLNTVPKKGAQFVPSGLHLAFIVPPYSDREAATRAKWHVDLFLKERARRGTDGGRVRLFPHDLYQAEVVRRREAGNEEGVPRFPHMDEPTPANFVLSLAVWMQRKAKEAANGGCPGRRGF